MKSVKIELGGREYYLFFNAEAMFGMNKLCGSANELIQTIFPETSEAYGILCKSLVLLSEQGELARRVLGYDKRPMLTEEQARTLVQPIETLPLKMAVVSAVTIGYGREVEDSDGVVDLVLQEIEKKTA